MNESYKTYYKKKNKQKRHQRTYQITPLRIQIYDDANYPFSKHIFQNF